MEQHEKLIKDGVEQEEEKKIIRIKNTMEGTYQWLCFSHWGKEKTSDKYGDLESHPEVEPSLEDKCSLCLWEEKTKEGFVVGSHKGKCVGDVKVFSDHAFHCMKCNEKINFHSIILNLPGAKLLGVDKEWTGSDIRRPWDKGWNG